MPTPTLKAVVFMVSAGVIGGIALSLSFADTRYGPVLDWQSRATPESQFIQDPQTGNPIRYTFTPFDDWGTHQMWDEFPTHAYNSEASYPPQQEVTMPEGIEGDPERGRQFFTQPPCMLCHTTPGAVFAMGNLGPDLRLIGERGLSDDYLYQVIYDSRVYFGEDAVMPPFGVAGVFGKEDIVHMVAYLQTLKGDPPGTPKVPPEWAAREHEWNPARRPVPPAQPDYDHLSDFDNPFLLELDAAAHETWSRSRGQGSSCASCHGAIESPDELRPLGVIDSLNGVAVNWPQWREDWGRVMNLETFLAVHAEKETGLELPTQSQANMAVSALVKSQSNGMAFELDTDEPAIKAAAKRGEELFARSGGWWNFSCMGCHTAQKSGGKFLANDYTPILGAEDKGLDILNYPRWRISYDMAWDSGMRLQFCGMPIRYLPGDSPEYADMEVYLLQFQQGETITVPYLQR